MKRDHSPPIPQVVRCAIYTRKSTEEGLQRLDAQREAGEAYIASQRHEGWECLPDHYDDGGFTGGNMDRPAMRRLMADIQAGRIDVVVVYKVDRLSRSLMDFARIVEIFERHRVSFVSVTQQFCTTHSMGRLTLNILLSFAQFEREIISERTRDKMAATRRKGKWSGGRPILGYDVDPSGPKLVVNEEEAKQVRAIFGLYLEHESLLPVVEELAARGWTNKRWVTRKGPTVGGVPFTKTTLHGLLTNVLYVGKNRYKDEVHDGQHPAIVDAEVWQQVQVLLKRNGHAGATARNKHSSLLKGLLRCTACDCAMTISQTTRGGNRRYRYYVCTGAQKRGWKTCPSKSVPAGEIERVVIDQIRQIGQDPVLVRATIAQVREQAKARTTELADEQRGVERELAAWDAEVRGLLATMRPGDTSATGRLADLQERIQAGGGQARDLRDQIAAVGRTSIDEQDVAQALAAFDPVWEALTLREQTRLVQLLVERVDYDGARGKVAITFHAAGIRSLAEERAVNQEVIE